MSDVRAFHGDSRDVLKAMPDNSVDAVVTDPPYALVSILERYGPAGAEATRADLYARATAGFMGQLWDTGETAFAVEFWREVLRVLKPGGYVLACSGTRTYHRLGCALEDAGFEVWDMVAWIYACGVPLRSKDLARMVDEWLGVCIQRGRRHVPETPDAQRFAGQGTSLKPALEPVAMVRKPVVGNLARNALAWGVGGLNIDACRVGDDVRETVPTDFSAMHGGRFGDPALVDERAPMEPRRHVGRWPANVVHDGSPEVLAAFPEAPGQRGQVTGEEPSASTGLVYYPWSRAGTDAHRGDDGSAARFFYSAKADPEDRLGSGHPTIKPVDFMAWLIRLVCPPGGTVLDPFAGSGTTGLAALREGRDAVLIEREAAYVADIRRRLAWARGEGKLTQQEILATKLAKDPAKARGEDLPLFAGGER